MIDFYDQLVVKIDYRVLHAFCTLRGLYCNDVQKPVTKNFRLVFDDIDWTKSSLLSTKMETAFLNRKCVWYTILMMQGKTPCSERRAKDNTKLLIKETSIKAVEISWDLKMCVNYLNYLINYLRALKYFKSVPWENIFKLWQYLN